MKYSKIMLLFSAALLLMQACRKDFTMPITAVTLPTGTVISFDSVILPILTSNCVKSGCHVTGGQSPDLSAANAYDALTELGLVPVGDTLLADAKSSTLYMKLVASSNAMPPSGPLSGTQIAEILAWIQQGSQNN